MVAQQEYSIPQSRKILLTVAGFAALFILNILMVVFFFKRGISIAGCVGISIALYLSTGQKITLTADRLIIKSFFAKARAFLYDQGTFSVEHITGAKALLLTLSPKASVVCYTPKEGGKKQLVTFLIAVQDVDKIMQQLQKANSNSAKAPTTTQKEQG